MLHYSTLSTMLWIAVTARNIYKQVTKKALPCPGTDQPTYSQQPLLRYCPHPHLQQPQPCVSAKWLTGKLGVQGHATHNGGQGSWAVCQVQVLGVGCQGQGAGGWSWSWLLV